MTHTTHATEAQIRRSTADFDNAEPGPARPTRTYHLLHADDDVARPTHGVGHSTLCGERLYGSELPPSPWPRWADDEGSDEIDPRYCARCVNEAARFVRRPEPSDTEPAMTSSMVVSVALTELVIIIHAPPSRDLARWHCKLCARAGTTRRADAETAAGAHLAEVHRATVHYAADGPAVTAPGKPERSARAR